MQPPGPSAGPKSFPAPVAPSVELLGPAPRKAAAPKVQQASPDMRFAVYLASFSSDEQALAGWQILQRRYQRPLAGLTPLVRRGKSKQGGSVFRLFAGPFEIAGGRRPALRRAVDGDRQLQARRSVAAGRRGRAILGLDPAQTGSAIDPSTSRP